MTIYTKSGEKLIYEKESYILRGLWMELYNKLGPGHKEVTFQNGFEELLKREKIPYIREPILTLYLDGKKVGVYRPDFIVFGKIIVEFKSLEFVPQVFIKKVYQYLKTSNYRLAFVVNFGTTKLQIIRRIYDTKRNLTNPQESACNPQNPCSQQGIAALLTIIIVGAATLIMAYTASILGLGELDLGYISQKGAEAMSVADGCVEETLRQICLNTSYTAASSSLSVENGSCIITVESSGNNRTIKVVGTVEDYNKKVEVDLTLSGSQITINQWQENSD